MTSTQVLIGPNDEIKVTKVETFVLKNSWVFVKTSTDAGITGWGEMRDKFWRIGICAFLCIIAVFSTVGCRKGPHQIRILSYNIHHGEGTDGRLDLERLAKVILSVQPDIVGLQEVDVGTERTDKVDQAEELARLTGMQAAFGSNLQFGGGDYGNAVLSRFPIKNQKNHPLPNPTEGEPRGALEVELSLGKMGKGALLRFVSTHFDHRGQASREAAAREINRLLGAAGDHPLVLAGDLNAVPESETLAILRQQWMDASRETQVIGQPERQIDYVLCRPAPHWKVVEVRVLNEPVASDHRPVLAVLEWTDE